MDGELRIAYTRSWAGGAVADLVSTYRRLYPGVEVVVHRGTSAQTVDLVRTGAVDIAVVRPPLDEDDRELPLIVLDTEPILVAVPVDHPFGDRATLELGDLVDVPVVFWPEANAPGCICVRSNNFGQTGRPASFDSRPTTSRCCMPSRTGWVLRRSPRAERGCSASRVSIYVRSPVSNQPSTWQ
ncbi:LysR family substrate-binding domain-containing protein [Rhodococcus sp. 3Y1]